MAYTGTDANLTSSFTSLILARPYISDVYYMDLKTIPLTYPKTHIVKNMANASEREEVLGELNDWSSSAKSEGAEFSYNNFAIGTTVTYTAATYVNGFDITEEMQEDNNWDGCLSKASEMAKGAVALMETKAAALYDNAFTSGTGADGGYLCSTTHNLINSGSTYSNMLTNKLDEDGLEQAMILADKLVNEGNSQVQVDFNTLYVPISLKRTAMELMGTDKELDSPNNNKNTYSGQFKIVVGRYLTDQSAWFLIADGKRKPKVLNRVAPQLRMVKDTHTGNPCFQGRLRAAFGFAAGQDVIGSTGVGA